MSVTETAVLSSAKTPSRRFCTTVAASIRIPGSSTYGRNAVATPSAIPQNTQSGIRSTAIARSQNSTASNTKNIAAVSSNVVRENATLSGSRARSTATTRAGNTVRNNLRATSAATTTVPAPRITPGILQPTMSFPNTAAAHRSPTCLAGCVHQLSGPSRPVDA